MDVPLFVSWLDVVRKMPCFNLRSLSLVMDDISDDLLITVVHFLLRLAELHIEGQTFYGAIGTGLDQHWTTGFEVLRMSNCPLDCSKRLESVKLGGFAKVKKFEVLTSPLLSDLVFDNMIGVARYQVYTGNMNVKLNKIKENYYLELDLNWRGRGEDTWYAYLLLLPK
ncbi:hypothetical protein FXO37_01673 [Capsicum annuum]|nr:hypothetical protein FXO37_01673 [Capsicum annuum]